MLRKLFISLIILSALTTDASAFSALALSAGLNPDYILSQFESRSIQPDKAEMISASADNLTRPVTLRYRLVSLLPEKLCAAGTDLVYTLPETNQIQFINNHITLFSDPSPPVC